MTDLVRHAHAVALTVRETLGEWRVRPPVSRCDALSLGLPEVPRALLCTGPHSHVRAYDAAADDFLIYGATERDTVLAEVGEFLAELVAEQALWPGDGLLPPPVTHT